MRINYADAIAAISAHPMPLLYIDTCILLDIVRSPIRDSIDSNSIRIAKWLLTQADSANRRLWLVTSETVETEWRDNINSVLQETTREILKIEAGRKHFLSVTEAATDIKHPHGLLETSIDLGNELKNLSESLLNACLIISPEARHMVAAMSRVKRYLPPANRGKAEPKDCEIYELFVGLCTDIRAVSITENLLFVSSNSKEYSTSNNGGVQPELTQLRATYMTNLIWTEAKLLGRV